MTSGVYPRKPGHQAGKKPMFTKAECDLIKLFRGNGNSSKPLTDDDIHERYKSVRTNDTRYIDIYRDAEAAHNIKEQPDVPERTFGNMSKPVTCSWTPMDDDDMPGTYDTACGRAWSFVDGGPVENDYHFCHGCGQPVEVKEQP